MSLTDLIQHWEDRAEGCDAESASVNAHLEAVSAREIRRCIRDLRAALATSPATTVETENTCETFEAFLRRNNRGWVSAGTFEREVLVAIEAYWALTPRARCAARDRFAPGWNTIAATTEKNS